MSISLNDLLEWRDRLSEQSGEEANMVRALIACREAELRARIADLIATVSQSENWRLQRCAAIARRVEQAGIAHLESIYDFFQNRSTGERHIEAPALLFDFFADERATADELRVPMQMTVSMQVSHALPARLANLHGLMISLESRVSKTPGLACGIQGIRLMRMVALMSQARSARFEKMRISGTQAVYRHS